MSKTLLYYGLEVENTPIFNSNIKLDQWHHILDHIKKNGVFSYNSNKVYYYKLNNIDIIETLENNKKMYNLTDFKIDIIDNSYMKLQLYYS
jgi:phage terminase large subunit-like protein